MPLNECGRSQARALARALQAQTFDHVVSSDLARALETARTIAGPAVRTDARWREFAFGEWEGLTWEEIVARTPSLREAAAFEPERYLPPGGESFEQVRGRVARALEAIRGSGARRALVATHAGPLHAALQILLGEGQAPVVRLLPASITRVTMDGERVQLITLNDVTHLDRAG